MSGITESAIEDLVIELLISQGYQYIDGPNIAPDGSKSERKTFGDIIFYLADC